MKFKTLLASVLLGTAGLVGTANAAIDSPTSDVDNTGGSELVLNVITTTQSYTRDLGISFGSTSLGAGAPTFTIAPDAALSSILGDIVGWHVLALDGVQGGSDTNAANWGLRVQLTSAAGASTSPTIITDQNSTLGPWFNLINTVSSHDTDTNGSSLVALGDGASANSFIAPNGGIQGSASVQGALGSTLDYFLYAETGTVSGFAGNNTFNITGASATPFGTWTLGTDGALTYNAIPIPAAVWLFGSALIGLVGVGRRNKT